MTGQLLDIFLRICFPIVAVTGVGWALDRKMGFHRETLVRLGLYLFVPCFIFVRLADTDLAGSATLLIPAFTLCLIAGMGLLGTLVARLRGFPSDRSRALALTTMFYNAGNFGLPLVILALGDRHQQAQEIQVFVIATINVATFTLGVCIASDDMGVGKTGPWTWLRNRIAPVLRMPSLYMIALALAVRKLDIPIQEFTPIWFPMTIIADALIPVALLTLGVQLSQTRWCREMLGGIGWAVTIRLIAGPVLGYLLILAFGFQGTIAATLLVGSAVPSAVNASLIASEFDADPEFAASVVMATTLLSVVPVTITIYLARTLFLS